MSNRFQRPAGAYTGDLTLNNRNKYETDSTSNPKVAISSVKMDGDFNYLINSVNTLSDELQGVVLGTLPDGSITAGKLAAASVQAANLVTGSVNSNALAVDSVTTSALASQAVTGNKIAGLAVDSIHLADGAVQTDKIANLGVTSAKLATGAVTANHIAAASVTADKMAEGSVTADKMETAFLGTLRKIVKVHPMAIITEPFVSTSTTFVDITGLAVTLTPASVNSKFMITATVTGTGADANSPLGLLLVRDTTPLGQATNSGLRSPFTFIGNPNGGAVAQMNTCAFSVQDAPATVSSVTYKVQTRLHNTATTNLINRSLTDSNSAAFARGSSSLTVIEYED